MTELHRCPKCDKLQTLKQNTHWLEDGVDIIYYCKNCDLEFVSELREPIQTVTHKY